MPQKPLKVAKTSLKKPAGNKHGKSQQTTKKGSRSKPPKRPTLVKKYNEEKEITKMINARNEGTAAGQAARGGGKLGIVKPPVFASASEKAAKKKGKEDDAAPMQT